MATSLFFMATEQNTVADPSEVMMRNSRVEIRTEAQNKSSSSRGRKAGSKAGQQNQKKQRLRGMGVAQLEQHIRAEEEKKRGDVVLQGFPSGGCRSRLFCASPPHHPHQLWGFVDTSTHELSSIPNQIDRCDTCFKKKRLDGDQNNGAGFPKYTINGYDPRSHGFFYDHHRSAPPFFNHAGTMEEFGSGNPRNGSGGVKEYYEFFPGKYDAQTDSVAIPLADCTPLPTSTIDLSLKL